MSPDDLSTSATRTEAPNEAAGPAPTAAAYSWDRDLKYMFVGSLFASLVFAVAGNSVGLAVAAEASATAGASWQVYRYGLRAKARERLGTREEQAVRAHGYLVAFERSVLVSFDCHPCPRCAELEMIVLEVSPNGRSFEVQCKHCGNRFRWKAVHPDTAEASNSYRGAMGFLGGTSFRPEVRVPPSKFSEGGGREPIPEGVRRVVWRRDGGRCVQCGAGANLHFDHIIPVAKGGATTVDNLQVLCAPCNMAKGAKI